MAAHVDVVIFDKNDFVGKLRIAHQLGNLLQHALTRLVERMRLPGKYKLHRTFRIVDQTRHFFDVGQNQVGALVGRKPARKTDGERIGTECAFQLLQHITRLVAARGLSDSTAAHEFDHP